MENEYYMLQYKPSHKSETGKTTGSFGALQFKNEEIEELLCEPLTENTPISITDVVEFSFDLGWGHGATLGDFHENPHYDIMVFSSRIIGMLQAMNIPDVQYIPARIYRHKPKDTFSDDYYILHILKRIDCFDKEKSIWKAGYGGEGVGIIDSLVLDSKVLETIPINERLIFQLDENPHRILFHKSIAEEINGLNPKGVYFYDLATWRTGTFYLHGFGPQFKYK